MSFPSPDLLPSPSLYPGSTSVTATSTPFTDGVLQSASAWLNTDLTNYLSALGSMFDPVAVIVYESGDPDNPATYVPGWSTLLNPTTCPTEWLPYLAQFVGAQVQPGTDDATARNQIMSLPAQHRGTPAAIVAAAQTQLTGDQTVYLIERSTSNLSTDAYHAVLGYFADELLSTEQLLVNAVEAVKPAGIQITYEAITGWTWNLANNTWAAETMTWGQTTFIQP